MTRVVMLLAFLAALLPLLSFAQGPKPPRWPERFSVEFNESSYTPVRRRSEGVWHYDYSRGYELLQRNNGRGDQFCGSIHPFTDTPCTQLVRENVRYIIYPDLGECCQCCTSDQGCGVRAPTWLDEATFEGPQYVDGVKVDKWQVGGFQKTNVYWLREQDKPFEIDYLPAIYIRLHPETYNTEEINDDVFRLPSICSEEKKCPFFSSCTVARGFNFGKVASSFTAVS